MITKYLGIKAGKTARKKLLERGLRLEDVEILAAPASGPKWLALYELDKFLMKHLFEKSNKKRHFIGSSAGAWRATAYCLKNPITALERLHDGYIHQSYLKEPSGKEISIEIRKILTSMLEAGGTEEILNPIQNYIHISTSRSNIEIGESRSLSAKLKFLKPILSNAINRKHLGKYFERHIFSTADTPIFRPDGLKSSFSKLTEKNLLNVLEASGAIPMVMNSVKMNKKEYYDGGVTDYHWGVDFTVGDGIVLLPHFRNYIAPGWFDKYLPYRKAKGILVENTVMVYAKKAFIDILPNQRLTDMEDFYEYLGRDKERFDIWKKASGAGKFLVDDFSKLMNAAALEENIESF